MNDTKRMTDEDVELAHGAIMTWAAQGSRIHLAVKDHVRARQSEAELRKMLQRLCDAIGAEPSESMTPEQAATFAVYMEAAQLLERSAS